MRSYAARQKRQAEREAFRAGRAAEEAVRRERNGQSTEPVRGRRQATEAERADMKKGVWVGQDANGRWSRAPF